MAKHDTSHPADIQVVPKSGNRKLTPGLKVLLVVAVMSLIAAAIYTIPSVNNAFGLATSRQIEPFTELYFTNPSRIVKQYETGEPQIVRFTIHNLEGRDVNYRYAIYVDGVQTGPAKAALIANGSTIRTTETIAVKSTKPRAEITVKLLNTNQSIHYWTEREQ